MEEIRRFLRYTLPGLATVLVGFGTMWLSGADLDVWIRSEEILGKFVGIFVASGAIGYLMANLYFALRWVGRLQQYLVIDHHKIIKNLNSKIEVWGPTRKWNLEKLSLFDSWSILTHYSVSRSKIDKELEAIIPACERMVDITHGLGSLCTGLGVLVMPFLLSTRPLCLARTWVACSVLLALDLVLWIAFLRSLKALQAVSNTAFVTSIMREYKSINRGVREESQKRKVPIYYENDEPT
jgi:hypothetical protein